MLFLRGRVVLTLLPTRALSKPKSRDAYLQNLRYSARQERSERVFEKVLDSQTQRPQGVEVGPER